MFAKLSGSLAAVAMTFTPQVALAQAAAPGAAAAYPAKPVRMIVPFAPGGTNDVLGRMLATHLADTWGRPVVVDNRTGADGIIGTEIAAKSPPDGYTLIVLSSGYAMNAVVRKLPYDAINAFDPIGKIGSSFLILSVHPSVPVNSVAEFVALAGKRPGEITIATSGGFQHFASALFKSLSRQNFNIIVYKGGFPAMIDTIGGQTHSTFAVSVPAIPHLKSGKLKGLAVGTLKRVELLPDLPTVDEAGVKGYDASNWYSVAAPAGTPRPIVMQLHNEMVKYFTAQDNVKRLTAMGAVLEIMTPEQMRKFIPAEIAKWTKVAIDAGMPREVK
ncbi:MAG: tripartite tricarboxylate transporter substrate binding protein [Betaproteobacteria bacterium]|nr:tripartite tricarboxylate transporter substrate binding protein [Betaproteobacteria bacterium]